MLLRLSPAPLQLHVPRRCAPRSSTATSLPPLQPHTPCRRVPRSCTGHYWSSYFLCVTFGTNRFTDDLTHHVAASLAATHATSPRASQHALRHRPHRTRTRRVPARHVAASLAATNATSPCASQHALRRRVLARHVAASLSAAHAASPRASQLHTIRRRPYRGRTRSVAAGLAAARTISAPSSQPMQRRRAPRSCTHRVAAPLVVLAPGPAS